jgi:hypothetical protein
MLSAPETSKTEIEDLVLQELNSKIFKSDQITLNYYFRRVIPDLSDRADKESWNADMYTHYLRAAGLSLHKMFFALHPERESNEFDQHESFWWHHEQYIYQHPASFGITFDTPKVIEAAAYYLSCPQAQNCVMDYFLIDALTAKALSDYSITYFESTSSVSTRLASLLVKRSNEELPFKIVKPVFNILSFLISWIGVPYFFFFLHAHEMVLLSFLVGGIWGLSKLHWLFKLPGQLITRFKGKRALVDLIIAYDMIGKTPLCPAKLKERLDLACKNDQIIPSIVFSILGRAIDRDKNVFMYQK